MIWYLKASSGFSKLGKTQRMPRFPSGSMEVCVQWCGLDLAITDTELYRSGWLLNDGLASGKRTLLCWQRFQLDISKSVLLEQRCQYALHWSTCSSRIFIVSENPNQFSRNFWERPLVWRARSTKELAVLSLFVGIFCLGFRNILTIIYNSDVPTNCTLDLRPLMDLEYDSLPVPFKGEIPAQNNTFLVGTMGSQNMKSTVNSTAHAGKFKFKILEMKDSCVTARLMNCCLYIWTKANSETAHAIWHFAQTWFEEFPFYKPNDEKISIWTESYGGKYGPAFASFFEEQNDKIANGTITTPGAHRLQIDTLGIINGCSDFKEVAHSYPLFAYNVSNISISEVPGLRDCVFYCVRLKLNYFDCHNTSVTTLGPKNEENVIYLRHHFSGVSSLTLADPRTLDT